jgi:uncharacterized protein
LQNRAAGDGEFIVSCSSWALHDTSYSECIREFFPPHCRLQTQGTASEIQRCPLIASDLSHALTAQSAHFLVYNRSIQMAGWFELSKSTDGQFRFVLKAGNGEIILTSELYRAKSSAETGIASVQTNCATDDRYERKTAVNGKAYFNLKAANSQVIGTSQMYASTTSREDGISSVKLNGSSKTIKDNT